MEIKYYYSSFQLEKAAKFIAINNPHFKGQIGAIKTSILESITRLVEDYPKYHSSGTMGYYITLDELEIESMDNDENLLMFDIMVDPAVGFDHPSDDYVENILHK